MLWTSGGHRNLLLGILLVVSLFLSPLPLPNGSSSGVSVLLVSAVQRNVSEGYYIVDYLNTSSAIALAQPGWYTENGLRYRCPAGRYGSAVGLHDPVCSGSCARGYYCPPGSFSPFQHACGAVTNYCPLGSETPSSVDSGFYTISLVRDEGCPPGTFRNHSGVVDETLGLLSAVATQVPRAPCEACPAGTYKATTGDGLGRCLPCDTYTTEGSNAERTACVCSRQSGGFPLEEALPDGSVIDLELFFNYSTGGCNVWPLGTVLPEYTVPANTSLTLFEQRECPRGSYCLEGIRRLCPPGSYGAHTRTTDASCSGLCEAGYYCEEGSASHVQHVCGAVDVYCPEGSAAPVFVSSGYYTNEDRDEDIRTHQIICPKGYFCVGGKRFICPRGHYGANEGETRSTCSGQCDPGYYCEEGSTTPKQFKCGGPHVYCQRGASEPTATDAGFYSIHTGPTADLDALQDPENLTMSAEIPCEPGYYCENGVKYQCPPGRYGWQFGLSSALCSGPCASGYRCPSEPGSPHTSATEIRCGGVELYCPEGTGKDPLLVDAGHYTVGGSVRNDTRVGQQICEPGFFCNGGIRKSCPVGSFGNEFGLQTSKCSGFCPPGHKCPEATSEPIECGDGEYSNGGIGTCTPCPGTVESSTAGTRCRDSRSCCFL